MSPSLQKILVELDQLALDEQWQVLGYLMRQLQHRAAIVPKPEPALEVADDEWDQQIADDLATGKLAGLIAKAEADIATNQVRSLDEVLHHL